MEEEVKTAKMEIHVRIAKLEMGTKPLVVVHVEIIETIIEDTNV